jgi:hypothetical protein
MVTTVDTEQRQQLRVSCDCVPPVLTVCPASCFRCWCRVPALLLMAALESPCLLGRQSRCIRHLCAHVPLGEYWSCQIDCVAHVGDAAIIRTTRAVRHAPHGVRRELNVNELSGSLPPSLSSLSALEELYVVFVVRMCVWHWLAAALQLANTSAGGCMCYVVAAAAFVVGGGRGVTACGASGVAFHVGACTAQGGTHATALGRGLPSTNSACVLFAPPPASSTTTR